MTDNCPNCCHGAVESAASRRDEQQLTDRYRCPRCGHRWITRRNLAAYRNYEPAALTNDAA